MPLQNDQDMIALLGGREQTRRGSVVAVLGGSRKMAPVSSHKKTHGAELATHGSRENPRFSPELRRKSLSRDVRSRSVLGVSALLHDRTRKVRMRFFEPFLRLPALILSRLQLISLNLAHLSAHFRSTFGTASRRPTRWRRGSSISTDLERNIRRVASSVAWPCSIAR